MSSAALPVIPRSAIPSRSCVSSFAMRSTERLAPIARRSSSAWPPENPAATIATFISCSWNSGTPRVRFSTGSRSGCG